MSWRRRQPYPVCDPDPTPVCIPFDQDAAKHVTDALTHFAAIFAQLKETLMSDITTSVANAVVVLDELDTYVQGLVASNADLTAQVAALQSTNDATSNAAGDALDTEVAKVQALLPVPAAPVAEAPADPTATAVAS